MIEGIILVTILGLCSGSFVSMASFRLTLPKNKKISLYKRSFCVNCNNNLRIINLFPIFSYIFQKGKCSFCKNKISIKYPIIEILSAIFYLISFFLMKMQINLELILIFLMITILSIMIITDLEHYFIPNSIQIALFIVAIIYHITINNYYPFIYYIKSSLFYGAFTYCLYYFSIIFLRKKGIGIDDIKFFFIAGFFLGINNFIIFIFLTGLIGTIFGIIWMIKKQDNTFPFAPSMCISLYIAMHNITEKLHSIINLSI